MGAESLSNSDGRSGRFTRVAFATLAAVSGLGIAQEASASPPTAEQFLGREYDSFVAIINSNNLIPKSPNSPTGSVQKARTFQIDSGITYKGETAILVSKDKTTKLSIGYGEYLTNLGTMTYGNFGITLDYAPNLAKLEIQPSYYSFNLINHYHGRHWSIQKIASDPAGSENIGYYVNFGTVSTMVLTSTQMAEVTRVVTQAKDVINEVRAGYVLRPDGVYNNTVQYRLVPPKK